MSATTKQNCKFFLLRYVPNAIRGEFVNIGLVLLPPQGQPELRFSKDWSRVESLDRHADTELLDALRDELRDESGKEHGADLILRTIEHSFSNALQASEYKACLTTSPVREADELARIYLEVPRGLVAPRERTARHANPRQKILRSMKSAFSELGVWQRMQTCIPASKYLRFDDPLMIDCGYRVKSTMKMFQATPLKATARPAQVLAFSYPELRAGIERVDHAQADLTAIIEDGLEKNGHIAFALGTLDKAGIHVKKVSDLPGLARQAAREIGPLP